MKKHRKRTAISRKHPHRQDSDTSFPDAPRDNLVSDPLTGYESSITAIQGHQATKNYLCPECNDVIEKGTSHLVIVPLDAPDLRRHWHSYCWSMRKNRMPIAKKSRPKKK